MSTRIREFRTTFGHTSGGEAQQVKLSREALGHVAAFVQFDCVLSHVSQIWDAKEAPDEPGGP